MPRLYLLLGVVTGPLRSLILLAAWLFICKSSDIYIYISSKSIGATDGSEIQKPPRMYQTL